MGKVSIINQTYDELIIDKEGFALDTMCFIHGYVRSMSVQVVTITLL